MAEWKEADKGSNSITYGQSGEKPYKLLLSLTRERLIPLVRSEGMWLGSRVGSPAGLIPVKEKLDRIV